MLAGHESRRERGAEIVALPSLVAAAADAVATAGSLHAWAAGRPDARTLTGRGAAWAVELGGTACVVRHYRRGGTVARVLDDRYLRVGRTRPLREMVASARARERGVRTPEVLATVTYAAGLFYRADIATRFVPDSTDLAAATLGPARFHDDERLAAWTAAGALLRAAFAAGVLHRDLNLRNILVQRTDGELVAWLIDLDRAEVREDSLSDMRRSYMLDRLHRSRRKLEAQTGERAGAEELAAFAALAGDWGVRRLP
jgi:3-deoxy-D-manno-octulosonic acid kinase